MQARLEMGMQPFMDRDAALAAAAGLCSAPTCHASLDAAPCTIALDQAALSLSQDGTWSPGAVQLFQAADAAPSKPVRLPRSPAPAADSPPLPTLAAADAVGTPGEGPGCSVSTPPNQPKAATTASEPKRPTTVQRPDLPSLRTRGKPLPPNVKHASVIAEAANVVSARVHTDPATTLPRKPRSTKPPGSGVSSWLADAKASLFPNHAVEQESGTRRLLAAARGAP